MTPNQIASIEKLNPANHKNDEDQDFNGRIRNLELEREKLLVALHDAINRPMGVVPDSAMEFYDPQCNNMKPYHDWDGGNATNEREAQRYDQLNCSTGDKDVCKK